MRTWIAVFVLICLYGCSSDQGSYLISDVNIYDGTGGDAYVADVLIEEDVIKKIGVDLTCESCESISGEGFALSPGFIDLHAHLEPLPIIPSAESAIHMGVTTSLGGPDGGSPIRLGKYLDSLSHLKVGINVGYLIGHNSVRTEVMHLEGRAPSPSELDSMKSLIRQGMYDGAFGISTGLKYLPGTFSKIDEIVAVSAEAGKLGGIYTSHLREEGFGLIEGVSEAITISEEADMPVVLTHHKAIGLPMWGQSVNTLAMVDSARALGLDVMIDQYPYTASYTSISVLIQPWALEGGRYEAFAKRCDNPALRARIKTGIVDNILNDRGGGDLKRIQLARFNWKPHLEGKTLYDWALEEGMEPNAESGAELVIQAQLHRGASAIYHAMSEEDVKRIMAHPMTMIASDGRITEWEKGFPHPRVHGTFPRVIGHFARDEGVITVSEAIRKMTSLPAMRMGLDDRGIIKEGYKADLVLFNEATIIDKATFEKPHQYPEGIEMVMINGKLALKDGMLSKERYGEVLRGPAYKSE